MAAPTDPLENFLAFLDEAKRDAATRKAAYKAWLDEARPAIAAELTGTMIPADLCAAGLRFEWVEER
ncbi:hypothetical protein [Streptomyces sp. NPDC059928]|uniref:hypothetical protein n=1 Tax=unclassified Streptomyces TaxID=2593676 RepID=UPI00365E666A